MFGHKVLRSITVIAFVFLMGAFCHADPVPMTTARQVADNTLLHHLKLFGDWAGDRAPRIMEGEPVVYEGKEIAYNFTIFPSGHILVAADDDLEPVLLYSATSSFDPGRANERNTVESVLLPEFFKVLASTKKYLSRRSGSLRALEPDSRIERIKKAWTYFLGAPDGRAVFTTRQAAGSDGDGLPLSSIWKQTTPYNLYTPENDCKSASKRDTDNTLVGCVAVAWGQILYYWKWPARGKGSHSYKWKGQTLSADFNHKYNWADMLDEVKTTSSTASKEAVARLLSDLGIAAEMDYGCKSSGSSVSAEEVFDIYFKYKDSMKRIKRSSYTAAQWFDILKNEFDAQPQRPVALSIFTTSKSGHEVVADGYQLSSSSRLIHINLGWGGHYDGYYAITSDFSTGSRTWDADRQYAVIGIEPDNRPPEVEAGDDQVVEAGDKVVMKASVKDPEGLGIDRYYWTQLSGPAVELADEGGPSRSFTAPRVSSEKKLRFELTAVDVNRAVGKDYCTITIGAESSPPQDSEHQSSGSGSGGSGGGCFIGRLLD